MQWGPSEDDPEDRGSAGGGWVPPEDRSWRHPSELHAAGAGVVFTAAPGWRRSAVLAVSTAALVAIVAGALLLAKTGSTPGTATLDTMPVGAAAVTPCCTLSPVLTRNAEQAVVTIETTGSRASGCGVVVADGLVATTEAALGSARRVRVVAATGRPLEGRVLATDHQSGIVLLRLNAPLPVAHMGVGDGLGSGSPALAVSMRPSRGNRAPRAIWTSATVVAVGKLPPGAPPSSMAQITVRGPSVPVVPGEPLLDRRGRVLGILDAASGAERSFLPMPLVVGVTDQLETLGKVRHGWLGITDATLGGATGAEIVWVDPRGAAARALRPGDVIVRVDGWRVHSAADLRSMLYVMAPGTHVSVEAVRATRVIRAVVELAPSP